MGLIEYASKEMATSSGTFSYKWKLFIENKTAASCKGYLICYLKSSQRVTRYQHRWKHSFYCNGQVTNVYYEGPDAANYLPNDISASGTQFAGCMTMEAGVWYQWGNAHVFTWYNDGKAKVVGACMNCLDTIPWRCPDNLSSISNYTKSITAPTASASGTTKIVPAAVTADKITVTGSWYNYKLSWSAAANAVGYTVYSATSKTGAMTKERDVGANRTFTPSDYYKYPVGTTVWYYIKPRSVTGHSPTVSTSHRRQACVVGGGLKVTVNSNTKDGGVYVYNSATYTKAKSVYAKSPDEVYYPSINK